MKCALCGIEFDESMPMEHFVDRHSISDQRILEYIFALQRKIEKLEEGMWQKWMAVWRSIGNGNAHKLRNNTTILLYLSQACSLRSSTNIITL